MSAEEVLEQENETVDEHYLDHEEILDDYRRRQMIEHLTGPMISLFLHAVVVVACAVLMVGREVDTREGVEFKTKQLEVKPLEPKMKEKLDDLKEEVVDIVPPVKKPTLTPEKTEVETPDLNDVTPVMDTVDVAMDIKQTTSPITLPGLYSGRTAAGRAEGMKTYGGGAGMAAERAIMNALRWLKKHQNKDGSWSPKSMPQAMTGLALLTFLAHGETPSSEEFGPTVQKGLQWAANCMLTKNGLEHRGYSHGILTYALCEAYTMTKIPFLQAAMEKGLTRIIAGQQAGGGFDYNYAKKARWDLSVSAWQLQALKAGMAAGSTSEGLADAMKKGVDFLKNQAYAVKTVKGERTGSFGYSSPGNGSAGMQGAGVLCLELLGAGKSSQARSVVQGSLSRMVPDWDKGGQRASYEWYYCTQAIFHGGAKNFKRWYTKFVPMLVKEQKKDGHWDEPTTKGKAPGYMPYMATTLDALSLQVPYRYLPTYKVSATQQAAKKDDDPFDLDEDKF